MGLIKGFVARGVIRKISASHFTYRLANSGFKNTKVSIKESGDTSKKNSAVQKQLCKRKKNT
jgi:hypothetical protein